jgi:protein-arginine kinase activator protein McsA
MKEASRLLEYEKAAEIRDRIKELKEMERDWA